MSNPLFARLVMISTLVALSGCAAPMTRNGMGVIYTDTQDTITATDHVGGSKMGQACATNILGLVSMGDMTVASAKKAGSLTKVATVDYSQYSILGIWSKSCTIARGE